MADTQENVSEKKKLGFRTFAVIGGVVMLEAVLIIGAMTVINGPSTVQAGDVLPDVQDEGEKSVEVLVLDDRLLNSRSGVNYLYDTEIWVHVRQKDEERVADELTRFRNEIKSELMAIWRTADPSQLHEPKMENMTRKTQNMLQGRFGDDLDTGNPIIQKCLIVSGPGFRVEG